MRTHLTLVSCAAIAAALGTPLIAHAAASTNVLTNGTFEDDPIGGAPNGIPADGSSPFFVLPSGSVALTGWTVTKGSVDVVPNSLWQSETGAAGSFSVDLVGTPAKSGDPTPQTGGITQTVSGLTAGDTYLFSYWVSVNPGSDSYNDQLKNKILSVLVTSPVAEQTDTEEFKAAAVPSLATLYSPANLVLADGTRTFTNMQWEQITTTFTVPSTSINISFAAILNDPTHPTSTTANDILTGPVIDQVSLQDVSGGGPQAPEPASLSLLGAGMVALVSRRRRKI